MASEPYRRRQRGRMVSRRNGALNGRASCAQGVSRAGSSVDDAGRAAGSRDRLPLGQDPSAGLGPGARNGPDRLRVARPLLEARRAAPDVPVRPDLAMEGAGTRRFEDGPRAVAGDVPPERAGAGAAPAGVHAGRGAGIGGPVRGAREAGAVPARAPEAHGQHPPDPRPGPEDLAFRCRRNHRAQPLRAAEDLPGPEVQVVTEALRRGPGGAAGGRGAPPDTTRGRGDRPGHWRPRAGTRSWASVAWIRCFRRGRSRVSILRGRGRARWSRRAPGGIHPGGSVPVRWSRFSPRASSVSVLVPMPSMRFAWRAWTRGGSWPAASISSTIQDPGPAGLERHRRAPLAGGQELLQGAAGVSNPALGPGAPPPRSPPTPGYSACGHQRRCTPWRCTASLRGPPPHLSWVTRSIRCGAQEAQRFHSIK